MTSRASPARRFALLAALVVSAVPPVAAQATREDSAGVVLDAARTLERDGRGEAARELLRLIGRKYAGTDAASQAARMLDRMPRLESLGTGRTGFVLFNTLYGAFLGVAVPAAAGADGSGPYGAGLLIGAPIGFFGSRTFAREFIRSSGQAGIASFATVWGTWQGLGWQQVLGIGDQEVCAEFGCYTDASDTAPWGAMVAGGLAGLGVGYALAATRPIANGTASLINHSGFWGSWFGLALGRAAGLDDDDLLASTLVGGDLLLAAMVPASRAWRPTPSRVRLVTASGLAGALVGFGIDLLGNVDDGGTALGIPAATSALGLIAGIALTAHRPDLDEGEGAGLAAALIEVDDGVRVQVPFPLPTAIRENGPAGRSRLRPAARFTLLHASF